MDSGEHDITFKLTATPSAPVIKALAIMDEATRQNYFEELQEKLNPTIWVTEWLSYRLLDVQLSIYEGDEETIRQCIKSSIEILEARNLKTDPPMEFISSAPVNDETKADFEMAWTHANEPIKSKNIDALSTLSIYCFLHVAFNY
jgi:hypothetical protein